MKRKDITIFFVLLLIILFTQYDLLKPTIFLGLTPDDWSFIFKYKFLGPSPLSKIAEVWSYTGSYGTFTIYFMGFLFEFAGLNFKLIQLTNIFFKVINTAAIYPLIIILFRNRMLAFITTFLFAISFSTSSALETAVEPSEYLGMFLMSLFLIAYMGLIRSRNRSYKWLIFTSFLLMFSFCMSIMRIYPLVLFIPFVELFFWFYKPSFSALRRSLIRLMYLYIPFILLYLYNPNSLLVGRSGMPPVLTSITSGNWHLILTPFQGLAHLFPFPDNLALLNLVNIDSFSNYLSYLVHGPVPVFTLALIVLSLITPVKRKRFLLVSLLLNFFLEILIYFSAVSNLGLPFDKRLNFDIPRLYSTLLGAFVLSISLAYFIEWWIDKKHTILSLWLGPVFSLHFIVLTWVMADLSLSFGGPQEHYLLIPQLGGSLFVAAILTAFYENVRVSALRKVTLVVIFIVLYTFYILNKSLIHNYFNNALMNDGRAAGDHIMITTRFRMHLQDMDLRDPALFYFDATDITGDGRFYTEGFLSSFPFWMHFKGLTIVDGCVETIYGNIDNLKAFFAIKNEKKGILYRGFCIKNGNGGYEQVFYEKDNIYAFKLKNRDFIDIRSDVLRELGF